MRILQHGKFIENNSLFHFTIEIVETLMLQLCLKSTKNSQPYLFTCIQMNDEGCVDQYMVILFVDWIFWLLFYLLGIWDRQAVLVHSCLFRWGYTKDASTSGSWISIKAWLWFSRVLTNPGMTPRNSEFSLYNVKNGAPQMFLDIPNFCSQFGILTIHYHGALLVERNKHEWHEWGGANQGKQPGSCLPNMF